MVLLKCKICSQQYYVRPYRSATSKCCSRKCLWHFTYKDREEKRLAKIVGQKAHNNAGVETKCLFCKKSFHISPSRNGKKFFCSQKCYSSVFPKKNKSYKRISVNGIRVLEHRYKMEQKLGRKLMPHEQVHHKDHNHLNNDISNLELTTISEHSKYHGKVRKFSYRK